MLHLPFSVFKLDLTVCTLFMLRGGKNEKLLPFAFFLHSLFSPLTKSQTIKNIHKNVYTYRQKYQNIRDR